MSFTYVSQKYFVAFIMAFYVISFLQLTSMTLRFVLALMLVILERILINLCLYVLLSFFFFCCCANFYGRFVGSDFRFMAFISLAVIAINCMRKNVRECAISLAYNGYCLYY